MSHEPNEPNELLIASLLQKNLDTHEEPTHELPPEVEAKLLHALGVVAFLRNINQGALLSQAELQELSEEIQREVQQSSPVEERAAEELRQALEGQTPSLNEQAEGAFSAALFLQNSQQILSADFLLQLGQEVEQAAREAMAEPIATLQERQAADVLRQVLSGKQRVLSSAEVQKQVEAALGVAAYLRSSTSTALLSNAELTQLTQEVEQEAKLRLQKRRRVAIFGGASFLALAASVLLLGPIFREPTQETLEAKFPMTPTLEQEILPGSNPLERLDPMYEAGLRGMREARFLGAHYASQNSQ
jgi:hypothetical protein